MATFDPTIPITGTPIEAEPIRDNFAALAAHHAGATAPASPSQGFVWLDTSNGSNHILKLYDEDAWRGLFEHCGSTPVPVVSGGGASVPYLSGRWYNDRFTTLNATSDVPVALEMSCYPILITSDMSVDRIACFVGKSSKGSPGPGAPGDLARLGIYADDGDGVPGALVVDGGTVDISVSGESGAPNEAVISAALTAGLHWLACVVNNTGAGLARSITTKDTEFPNLGRPDMTGGVGQGYLGVIPSFAALPDPAPSMALLDFSIVHMAMRIE